MSHCIKKSSLLAVSDIDKISTFFLILIIEFIHQFIANISTDSQIIMYFLNNYSFLSNSKYNLNNIEYGINIPLPKKYEIQNYVYDN